MLSRTSLTLVLLAAFMVSSTAKLIADEKPKQDKPAAKKDKPAEKTDEPAKKPEEPDVYAVPKDATVKELNTIVIKLQRLRPRSIGDLTKQVDALTKAVNALLASEGVEDEAALKAVSAQLSLISRYTRFPGYSDKLDAAVKAAVGAKQVSVARLGQQHQFAASAGSLKAETKEEQQAFIAEAKKLFENDVTFSTMSLIMGIPQKLGDKNKALAIEFYKELQPIVAESKIPRLASYAAKFPGMARKLDLVGNSIDLKGTLLNGEQVDWSAYEGKVVLVDFWATWCGPCIAELPNVKKNYDLYHSKGFEVLGVSLDTSAEKVEAFVKKRELAWDTLYSADKKAQGWNHPMANYYGVNSIPMAVLVGKDGKVITLNARGPALGKELEKLLGKPEPVEDTTETGAEK
jgi:thiol-disulfide isomerase/thioredoxin